jgi:glycosyltransferase involved in cell wall biosynthesis
MLKKKHKKIILDMDDNLFEVKPDQPAWEFYKPGTEKRAFVSAFISLVDAIFVSTQPLKDYYEKYLKTVHNMEIPIYVLPNYCDEKDWQFTPTKKDENKVIIGWVGSTTHFNDLREAIPAVARVMKEHPNVHFMLTGGVSHEKAGELFNDVDDELLDRVFVGSGTESWEGFPEMMSKQQIDIGIAPLTNDEFNRGKSHIKWMEYAMYDIPTVASRVYPYQMDILDQNTIRQGETGYLCDKKEWYKTLKKLVENKELREKIGKQAHEYVLSNLQYKDHYHLWQKALSEVIWE